MPGVIGRLAAGLALLSAPAGLLAAATRADDAPYVGAWALVLDSRGVEQASPDAPMLVAEDHYDQHETHCAFTSVEARNGAFEISAECTVAGDTQTQQFTLSVAGDTLTFADETGARDFLRCE